MASSRNTTNQTRTLLVIAGIVAVVAIIGVIVAVVVGGGDDGDDSSGTVDPYRPVSVSGQPLPEFGAEMRTGAVDDPAIGQPVPIVSGVDYEGNATTIDPAADGPTMIVLLAHWCPHCNAEIPRLNEWRDSGEIPDGLNIVGVSTGVSPDRPNFPPDQWLVDKDWQWPVLADDANGTAMATYGGTSYPTMVLVDDNGDVFRRLSGEVPIDELDSLVDQLVGSSTTQKTG
jgi:cytochrome c biogenesis protein CcmG, thiol:disulfide interchange protein DsbE